MMVVVGVRVPGLGVRDLPLLVALLVSLIPSKCYF